MSAPAAQKKAFGKSTREVPHHTQKAQKWYPAEDEYKPKQVSSYLPWGETAAFNYGRSIWSAQFYDCLQIGPDEATSWNPVQFIRVKING
jgi:hypothetical protein